MARRAIGVRYVTLLLMLCLVVVAQSAALISASEQHETHCCVLCHVGPIPFLNTPVTFGLTPVFSVVRLESPREMHSISEVLLPTRSSRAPPSASLHS